MRYLLDTNAISDLMRLHPALGKRLENIKPPDEIITCTIVRGEILFGLSRLPLGERRNALTAQAESAFKVISCVGIPPQAADRYAMLKTSCQSAGVSMNENDLWIAATALELGAVLVTRDQDFHRLGNIAIENWALASGR